MNELDITSNKVVLDGNVKVKSIKNKDKYTSMLLDDYIPIKLLKKFINIKELTLGSNFSNSSINYLPFIDNLQKLCIINRKKLGDSFYYDYPLKMDNLKIIEFSSFTEKIDRDYLSHLSNLEEMIFNITYNTDIDFGGNVNGNFKLDVSNTNLKQIIINALYDKYTIKFDYKPLKIKTIRYSNELGIVLEYSNDYIDTNVTVKNDILVKINKLSKINDDYVKDECFVIPNYINSIHLDGIAYTKKINSISLSLKTLSEYTVFSKILEYIPDLKKIIIRKENDMSLFENIEINIEQYGDVKDVYILEKELYIELDNKLIIIDSNGNKKIKENKEQEKLDIPKKEEIIESKYNILNKFKPTELEYYTYYKKLIEYILDYDISELDKEETISAANVLEKQLIKKLEMEDK